MNSGLSGQIALTLIHSLWQAVAVLLTAIAVCRLQRTSEARYATFLSAFVFQFALSVCTLFVVAAQPLGEGIAARSRVTIFIGEFAPWIVWAWCIGVLAGIGRLAFAYRALIQLIHGKSNPAQEFLKAKVKEIAQRMRLNCLPDVRTSGSLESPSVIGWLRPIVLMPLSLVSKLSPEQLDALIAHELAHIRRHDFVVNLIQSGLETLYFFNPAIRWISEEIRRERENCCDDLAMRVTANPAEYANALAALISVQTSPNVLLASASGGDIVERFRRIGRKQLYAPSSISSLVAMVVLVFALCIPIGVIAHRDYTSSAKVQSVAAPAVRNQERAPQQAQSQGMNQVQTHSQSSSNASSSFDSASSSSSQAQSSNQQSAGPQFMAQPGE